MNKRKRKEKNRQKIQLVQRTHWQGEGQRVKREGKKKVVQVNDLEALKDRETKRQE